MSVQNSSTVFSPYKLIADGITATELLIENLELGHTYFFAVTPVNAAGAGVRSVASSPFVARPAPGI